MANKHVKTRFKSKIILTILLTIMTTQSVNAQSTKVTHIKPKPPISNNQNNTTQNRKMSRTPTIKNKLKNNKIIYSNNQPQGNISVFEIEDNIKLVTNKEITKKENNVQETTSDIIPTNIPTNQIDLRTYLINQMSTRTNTVNLYYNGDDLYSYEDLVEFIMKVVESGNYNLGNTESFTISNRIQNENGIKLKAEININYRTTNEEEKYINETINKIIAQNNADKLTERNKVKFVNDFLIDHMTYTKDTLGSRHSPHTGLKEHKGVCASYALLATKMLDKLGIETNYIVGKDNNEQGVEFHAWNRLKINGKWLNLDTTWNDTTEQRYKYFLLTDEEMSKSHVTGNIFLPY